MLECLICHEEYNYSENLPKTLPDCGHTICSACLAKIMDTRKCPECRKGFSFNTANDVRQFQTNIALQRIIETMTSFCKEHQSPLTQVCLTDKIKVCVNCVKYEGHKDHVVKSIENVKTEARKKIQEFEKLEKEVEENTKQELEFLSNYQKEILKLTQEEDEDSSYKQILDAKRKQYLWEIESLFAQKRDEYKAKIANRISYNEKIIHLKEILEEGEINTEYLQALEENIEYPPIEDEALLKAFLQNATQELEAIIVSKVKKFTTATASLIQQKSFAEINGPKFIGSDYKTLELAASLEVLRRKYFNIRLVEKKCLVLSPRQLSQIEAEDLKNSFFDTQNDLEKIDSFLMIHTHVHITDEMVDGIHYIWKNLPSPISVRLYFEPYEFTKENLFSCFKYPFWKAGSLETLCISLFRNHIENQSMLLKFLQFCGQRVPDLTGFSLILHQTDLTDDAFVEAFLKLIPLILKNLERLNLSLAKNKITQKSIASLFLFLQDLKKLKEFSLDISETNIGESGLDTLFQGLHHFENYEYLALTLGNLPIKDKHIQLLIQKYFKSARLTKLLLSFDSTHLEASNIEIICSEIPKQLSALDLSFSRTKITDDNIQTLATSLASMPNLSILSLDFKDTQVEDDSIMALCETFSKDTTILQELKLNFYNTKISEQTLRFMLTEIIPKISTLVKFYIHVKKNYMGQEMNILVDQINKKYE